MRVYYSIRIYLPNITIEDQKCYQTIINNYDSVAITLLCIIMFLSLTKITKLVPAFLFTMGEKLSSCKRGLKVKSPNEIPYGKKKKLDGTIK